MLGLSVGMVRSYRFFSDLAAVEMKSSEDKPQPRSGDVESLVQAKVNKASSPVEKAEAFLAACKEHGIVGDQREELYQNIIQQPVTSRYVRKTGFGVRGVFMRTNCRQQSFLSNNHGIY